MVEDSVLLLPVVTSPMLRMQPGMIELVFGPMALIKSIRPQAMQVGMVPKVFAFFLFGVRSCQ